MVFSSDTVVIEKNYNAEESKENKGIKLVEMPMEVREKIMALEVPSKPTLKLKKVHFDTQNSTSKTPLISEFEYIDSHIYAIGSLIIDNKSNTLSRCVSLKGLIELACTTEATSEIQMPPIGLMVAGSFLSVFGVKQTLEINSIFNTTDLSGDLSLLTNPRAGDKFSYIHSWELKQVTKNIVSINSATTNKFYVSCFVENPVEAVMLNSKLNGMYLPVTCNGKNNAGKEFKNNFAFLLDSQMYLSLSMENTYANTNYTIKSLEYNPR